MMYESKYKYKHAERRVRLFPEKVEPKIIYKQSDVDQSAHYNNLVQQQQASCFSQQQQAQQNTFGGIAGLLGGAAIFGR